MSESSDDQDDDVVANGEVVYSGSEDEDDDEDDQEAPAAVEVAVAEADSDEDDESAAPEVQAAVVLDDDENDDDDDDDDDDDNDNDDEDDENEEDDDDDDGISNADDAVVEAVAVVAEEDSDEDDQPLDSLKTPKKAKKTPKKSASSAKSKDSSKRKKKKPKRLVDEDLSGQSLSAANAAREMLLEAVPTLPIQISDNFIVRSFGQLNVDAADKFSSSNALYPVGFSCDRYEFSPVHGRVIKLRCTILHGKRTKMDYDGPIFRIMWGQGVNEDVDKVEYPYDPYANSAPITSTDNDDVVAIPASAGSSSEMALPAPGMRVKVRFEKDQFYHGTIDSVDESTDEKKKKKRRSVDIVIQYEDGSMEEAVFPDPDITLVMPGKACYCKSHLFHLKSIPAYMFFFLFVPSTRRQRR
jgi:hypothetical protein